MRDSTMEDDVQPGMSTFDRNHPASFINPEPRDMSKPAEDLAAKMRRRIIAGQPSPSDGQMILEAVMMLDELRRQVDNYRERWIRALRKEADRGTA